MRIYLLIGWLILAVTGCYTHAANTDYPNKWGKLIPKRDTGCLDVTGRYINMGDDADHPKRPIGFSLLLYQDKRKISHIQISQTSSDSIEITLWDESNLVDRKYYKKDRDYFCTNEEIALKSNTELVGENVIGLMKTKHILMKSDDGYLVIKQHSEGAGLAFGFIPMGGGDYQWYRFKEMLTSP